MVEVLNPVLLKEIRQSLRGRTFRFSLALTLVAATLVTTILVLSMELGQVADAGVEYLTAIYACLAIALIAIVPFSAFQSMGAEWEESTYDLLVLSDLKPRRIIIGKWLSSLVLALLFVSAFAPFITFAFLLRGVDFFAMCVLILGTVLVSGVLSASSIAISSSTPTRFVRLMMIVALAAGLLSLVPAATGVANQLLTNAGVLADPDLRIALFWLAVSGLISVAMSVAIACARIAHPEENRSSGMRVIGTLGLSAGLLATTHFYLRSGQAMLVMVMGVALLVSLFTAGAWLCVEAHPLGRRVRTQVPRFGAFLCTPWLPGGARGFLYVVLHASLVLGALALLLNLAPASGVSASGIHAHQVLWMLIVLALYGVLFVGLPPLFLSRSLSRPGVRRAVLVAMPVLAVAASLLPALYGLMVEDRLLQEGMHLGFPGFLLGHISDERSGLSELTKVNIMWLAGAAATVVFLHLPRFLASLVEVAQAARERRRN